MAQGRQGEVNLGGLLETVAGGACLCNTFGARQINHVKLSDADVLLSISAQFAALNRDGK